MNHFRVEWEDEGFEDCSTPLEAAKQAAENISNRETLGFTVTNMKTGQRFSVDLDEEDEDAVIEIKKIKI